MEQDILFFLSAFIAEIVGTIAGFGSSTIFLPVALFFVDFKTAIILVAIFHISGNISRITFFKHGLNWKILATFGIPSVLLALLGAHLIDIIPQDILKLILGIFLISFSAFSLRNSKSAIPANQKTLIAGGALSGFLAGLIGTGGALRASFLTGFNLEKFTYIATAASIALVTDATRIPVYISQSFLDEQFYYYIPVLIGLAAAGSYLGRKIVGRINQDLFRKIVLIAIILVSIKFVLDGVSFFRL
ncbi:MAG TPA: sulfite exporter TauE/SafE family protein [Nitrosopumilaceae archaeon]|jgi:uncharacterized membrane protein YfcA